MLYFLIAYLFIDWIPHWNVKLQGDGDLVHIAPYPGFREDIHDIFIKGMEGRE